MHYKINSSTILWGIEDTPLHIEGISVSDVDISDDGYLQVTLACTNGTVRFHDSTIRDMLNVSYEVLFHGLLYEDGHQVRLPYPHQLPLLFSPLTHGMTALTPDIIIILLLLLQVQYGFHGYTIVTFTASIQNLNNAFKYLFFDPEPNYYGTEARLAITVNDLGT